jgi:hypothetical protein
LNHRASAGCIAPIVIGFCLLVALGFYEAYVDLAYPIFPPVIFKNTRGFTVILAGVLVLGMLYYSSAVLWPQQVRNLYTKDPITLGWYASTMGISGTIFAPIFGFLFRRVGHARILFTAVVAGLAIFSALQALVSMCTKFLSPLDYQTFFKDSANSVMLAPGSAVVSTIMVACVGALVNAAAIASATMIQLGVPHEYMGVGTAMAITARSIGGSVGTTVYTSILENRLVHYIPTDIGIPLAKAGAAREAIPHIIEALLSGNTTTLKHLTPEVLTAGSAGLKQAFAHSFRIVYLVTLAFGVTGTICVAFSRNVDDQMTKKVDIKLEEGAHIVGHGDTGGGHIIKHS